MWTARSEELADGRGLRCSIEQDGDGMVTPISYARLLHLWESDASFRTTFTALLAAVPYDAFRWETPPVTIATVDRPFEFVVRDSPGLALVPDPDAFAEHFSGATAPDAVIAFPNLSGDALLIVPGLSADSFASAYGHLAAFVRYAPEPQQHTLWQQVARAMRQRLGDAPVWLSTAGAGVSWLHIRLDDHPKYYGYAPYRRTA